MRNKKGFTLIELLVVILIIGILLALIIPNFVLFQERARRTSVKNNMHVVQTALEAYATDHYGAYPAADIEPFTSDAYPEDGGIAVYFPGGDAYGISGDPILGKFPTNPYTARTMDSDNSEDLLYGDDCDLTFESEPGVVSTKEEDSPSGLDCPYVDYENPNGIPGSICVAVNVNETTLNTEEYGICGFGRDLVNPMWDKAVVEGEEFRVYFILHN